MRDLKKSEELWRITLQSIGDGLVATDEQGCVTHMNPVAEEMTGWPLHEARGKLLADVFAIVNSITGEPADNPVTRVLETGAVVGLANHTKLISRNGAEYQVMDSAAPIRDDGGKTRGVILVFSDVTEKYRDQEALRQSEERWKFALEGAGDGVWDRNLETGEVFFSRRWKEILGYEDHEIGNRLDEWLDRIHPEDREGCRNALDEHFMGRSPLYLHEYRLQCRDGSYKWILARGKVIARDSRGTPLRFVGTHTDITGRKQEEFRKEEALREARRQARKQRRHLEMLSELMVDLSLHEDDLTGGLITMTETAAEILESDRTGVWFYNDDCSELVCRDLYDRTRNWHESGVTFQSGPISDYNGGQAPGQVIAVSDVYADHRTALMSREYFDSQGIRSLLHVPIMTRGRLAAVLRFEQSCFQRDWLPEEKQMALTLGACLASYLEGIERRQAEEKYRSIFENALEGIFQSTQDGRFLSLNPAFARMAGYESVEEMIASIENIGQDLYLNREDRLRYREILERQGFVTGFEIPLRRKDGATFWVALNTRVVRDHQGDILYYEGIAADITDRKKADRELKRYREFIENIEDACFELDLSGNVTFCNEPFLALSGFTAEEHARLSHRERHPTPEEARRVFQIYLDVYRTGIPAKAVEYQVACKDGSVGTIEVSISLVRDGSGNPTGFRGIGRDISDRKRIEQEREQALGALRESEGKYRLVVENVNDVIWTYDLDDMNYAYLSPSVETVYGYSPEQIKTKTLEDLYPPRSLDRIRQGFNDLRNGLVPGDRLVMELEHHVAGGDTIWIELGATVIRDKDGRVTGFSGVSRDIRDRKKMEKEREKALETLRESEERYRDIFRYSPDSVTLTGLNDGVYYEVNDEFLGITGYTRDEVIGKTTAQLGMWDDLKDRERFLEILTGQGYLRNFEARFRMKDGRVTTGLISSSLLTIDGVPYIQAITRDITDMKEMEEQRQDLERRLARAQKLESIGTLAGGIAHDFNNLLMGIQGYTSLMLLDLEPSHEHYTRLKHIEEQVASGSGLTAQLLGFARGGRYEVKPASMNDIVEKTAAMFGRTKREVTIHKNFMTGLWSVEVDRTQMEQVFMNLYVNAWQAMSGGGELYLETGNVILDESKVGHFDLEPGPYVKISVTDTGMGMDEKTRERIFDPFFSTKSMGRGTGLGLATVYGIVRGHRGIINVYSEPGRGTTFAIYLPASEGAPVCETPETEGEYCVKGSETILLVDDEPMVLEVSRELLESLGYRVLIAGSGQEAVSLYAERGHEIDLVILDMIMPGISGSGTFDELRELNPDVKIILSSGYSINGEAKTIMERGCNAFLQKPFHLRQLARKIRDLLD